MNTDVGWRMACLLSIGGWVVPGGAGCAVDPDVPGQVHEDPGRGVPTDDDQASRGPRLSPSVVLPAGNQITRIPVTDADGTVTGELLVESVPVGQRSSLEYLRELAPELDGEEAVAALADPAGELHGRVLAALDAAPHGPAALSGDLACNNASFNGWGWVPGGAVGPDSFIRNDKTPANYAGAFDESCYNPYSDGHCHGHRYAYRAWWNATDEWVGKLCGRAVGKASHEAHGNDYVGPSLSFQRYAGGAWTTLTYSGGYAIWSIPANETRQYYFHYVGAPEELAVRISNAVENDQFDIMMNR